jgi:hypothetical protein
VRESKRAREQQEAERLDGADKDMPATLRVVGRKTFYLRDGVWVDAEFKADAKLPETTLKFAGDDYFALLKQKPRLADFFSLGEQVVVVFEGRVYRITSQ